MEKNSPLKRVFLEKRVKVKDLLSIFCCERGVKWQRGINLGFPRLAARICSGFSLQLIIDREDLEGRQGTKRWGYQKFGEWLVGSFVATKLLEICFFDFKLFALFHIRAENFKLKPTGKKRICFCSCESERENFHHKHFTSEIFIVRFGSLSDSGVFWFDMPWWLLKNWVGIFLFPIHQKAGYPTGFPLVFVDFRGSWRFWGNRLVSDVPPVKVLKRQKASKKVHDQAWNIGDNLVLTGSLSRAEGSSLKGGVFVFCGRGNWIE